MASHSETDLHDDDLPERHVTMNQVVAYNVAYFRKERGLTQEQLGRRLERITGKKWSKATMSALERSWDGARSRLFDADDLMALSQALDYPVAALLLPPQEDGVTVAYHFENVGGGKSGATPGSGEMLMERLFISDADSSHPEDEAYAARLEDAFNFYFGGVPDFVYYRTPSNDDYVDEHEMRAEQAYRLKHHVSTLREIMGGMERAVAALEGQEAEAAGEDASEISGGGPLAERSARVEEWARLRAEIKARTGVMPTLGDSTTIGRYLRTARIYKDMTVDEVSAATGIRSTIIEAMEKNDFSKCGGRAYVKGHIRVLAVALGLRPKPLLEQYDEEIGKDVATYSRTYTSDSG